MGLTEDNLIFIKHSSRLSAAKRLTLSLRLITSVECVESVALPFVVPDTYAFSVSTFSRKYLIMLRGADKRDGWVAVLNQAISQLLHKNMIDESRGEKEALRTPVLSSGYASGSETVGEQLDRSNDIFLIPPPPSLSLIRLQFLWLPT